MQNSPDECQFDPNAARDGILLHGLVGVDYVLHLRSSAAREEKIEREERNAGNLMWNCALALKNCGARVHIVGNAIGDDSNGRLVARENAALNLQLNVETADVETPYRVILQRIEKNARTLNAKVANAKVANAKVANAKVARGESRNSRTQNGDASERFTKEHFEEARFSEALFCRLPPHFLARRQDAQKRDETLWRALCESRWGEANQDEINRGDEAKSSTRFGEIARENGFAVEFESLLAALNVSSEIWSRTRVFCCSDELPFSSLLLAQCARAAKIPFFLIETKSENTGNRPENAADFALQKLRSLAQIVWTPRDLDAENEYSNAEFFTNFGVAWRDERALQLAQKLLTQTP